MNLNFVAPVNTLSYGYTSLNLLKSLASLDTSVALFPISDKIEVTNQSDADVIQQALSNARLFDVDASCIRLWHQHDMSQFAGRGPRIGFPIFELDTFNDVEKHHLRSVDRLFVCSEWAAGVIKLNGIDVPTSVVPLGVDSSIFKCAQQTPPKSPTILFNGGKWEVRKGHDILFEAFQRAFKKDDNVELWMMTANIFNSPAENGLWASKYNSPQVKILPRMRTQEDVYNIMSKTDCGVFPARAEGWNLEALEMMACGKQVIITDCTAHTEYCSRQNAHLIEVTDLEPAFDGKWFNGQGQWAQLGESQIQQLADYMRSIHERKQRGDDLTNDAGLETAATFTWENSARKLVEHV